MMNFSLWMALAFAQSQKMTQLMAWPLWPYTAALAHRPKAAPAPDR